MPGWLRAESGNASVDVTGTDPVKVDVSVVNKGDSEPELICAVPLTDETGVLELGTKPDGTWIKTVPSRLWARSGEAIVDVTTVEPV